MKYKANVVAPLLLIFAFTIIHARVDSNQSSKPDFKQVSISMKTEGGPCGCVPLNETDLSCCPAYSVSIDETGTVKYEGIASVKVRGKHIHHIAAEQVKELVGEFYKSDFFSLEDRYIQKKLENGLVETIDHSNATTISIIIDGKTKSVYNFYGAPQELIDLQRKIYETSKVARYVGRA
jgi:hypothetical protein